MHPANFDPGLMREIEALLTEYCHCFDSADGAALALVFHEDGATHGPGRPSHRGHDAISRFVIDLPRPDALHVTSNTRVERQEGDRIWTTSNYVVTHVDQAGNYGVLASGKYHDILERRADALRILERRSVPLSIPSQEEAL